MGSDKDTKRLMEELSRYYTLWRESQFIYEEWAKARGLSFNSVMVLYSIYEDSGCTQKMISRKWLIPKQTVNTILNDFERRGLIRLEPLESDKRNKAIRATDRGKQYAREVIDSLRELELYVLERMGLERIRRVNEDMALFVELFCQGEKMIGRAEGEIRNG